MLTHTPYAQAATRPFAIGLQPLDLADWIEVDAELGPMLAEKQALHSANPARIFGAKPDTDAAQREVLDLLARHLPLAFPNIYVPVDDESGRRRALLITPPPRRDGTREPVRGVVLVDAAEPPLWTAAKLVQEDLVLMRRDETGWRLVAGALAFPSAWRLEDKFGQTMAAIHEPVPGFAGRMHDVVARIFDNLKPEQPVWRLNWSIYADAQWHHSEPHERGRRWHSADPDLKADAFIRIERQTLRRLSTGDILFTIRIFVDPFQAFVTHPEGRSLAAHLRDQIAGLNPDQIAYKGLSAERDRVVGALDRIATRF